MVHGVTSCGASSSPSKEPATDNTRAHEETENNHAELCPPPRTGKTITYPFGPTTTPPTPTPD